MATRYDSRGTAVGDALKKRFVIGAVNMGGEMIRQSTAVTPYDRGDLRIRRRVVPMPWGAEVQWLSRHAAVQNRGSRLGRPFRHYTTSGTGKGFVQYAIRAVMGRLGEFIK